MNYPDHDDFYFQDPKNRQRQLWLKHVPVISTAHISKADGLRLTGKPQGIVVDTLPGDAGHMVLTAPVENAFILTMEFRQMLFAFSSLGYHWIILDRDGDKVEGLTTFDW